MTEEEIYAQVKKRVEAKKSFYGNLGAWVIVNVVLIIVWAISDFGGNPWFQ